MFLNMTYTFVEMIQITSRNVIKMFFFMCIFEETDTIYE